MQELTPRQLLEETASRLGITPRQVCEQASEIVGTATYIEFEQTGKIPLWLQAGCEETLLRTPRKATDLLTQAPVPVMGMSSADMHDLDFDD